MKKKILILLMPFMLSCQGQSKLDYKYSEKEVNQFLSEITKNIKATITNFTFLKKQPTEELLIFTKYPLSELKLKEYNENNKTIKNTDNDISDYAEYTFKSYELINENDEKLQLVDNGGAVYLQKFSLWEYDNVLYQKLGIKVKLNKKYEKLKGYIIVEFEMPEKIKREVNIPIDISIFDTILE